MSMHRRRGTLAQTARTVLRNERVLWFIAAAFALHHVWALMSGDHFYDGRAFVHSARVFLSDPSATYAGETQAIHHQGGAPGQNEPPAALFLSVPFALLPGDAAVVAFAIGNGVAILFALWFLQQTLHLRGWHRPLLWASALAFEPLFAVVETAQIDGFLLLAATLSLYLLRGRPVLSGVVAGFAAAVKIYPAALGLGVLFSKRLKPYLVGAILGALVTTVIPVLRIGAGPIRDYVQKLLLPSLHITNPDCAQNSIGNLWQRLVGGAQYPVLDDSGLRWLHLPWSFPTAAAILTVISLLLVIGASLWAARRSGWDPIYSSATGFALGAVVPGELYPYQALPLLPLIALTIMAGIKNSKPGMLLAVAAGFLVMLRDPCSEIFPSIWTAGVLLIFFAGVRAAPLVRRAEEAGVR